MERAAVPPPGDAKVDQAILATIFLKVRELYQQEEPDKFPDPILNLAWAYTTPQQSVTGGSRKGDQRKALADCMMTSRRLRTGKQASSYRALPG